MEELKVGDAVFLYSKEELLKRHHIDEQAHDMITKQYEFPATITSISGKYIRFNNENSGWYLSWFYKANKREQECIGL